MNKSTVIDFLNVTRAEIDKEALWGFAIDHPKKGNQAKTYTIEISGWVLGKKSKVVAVEVLSEGRVLGQVPVNIERLGVSKLYPGVSWAKRCGFNIEVGVIGLPLQGEVRIRAVLENRSTVLLGIIHYHRQPLHSNYQAKLQPLVFTSSGRSGTTWLMRIFSQHPSIIASEFYPYEFRVSQYWIQMLNILSQPRNPDKFQGTYFYQEFQSIGPNPYHGKLNGHAAHDWLGRDYPEQFADFCRHSIDNLYEYMGRNQGKIVSELSHNTDSQHQQFYFVEKFLPNPHRKLLLEVYPQAKEIVLVRDFRDICCSALAFNTKRGYMSFGRQRVDSDREYVKTTIKNTAANLLEIWRERKEEAHLVRYEDLILAPEQTL
ncbi:MAG: sulfotransferase, partial [Okeania sp. SIO2D1]|nr:sulfotransferase [Okeania sp. SIO2D1]